MTQPCYGSGLTKAWTSIVMCMYVLHMWHPGTFPSMRQLPLLMSLSNCYVHCRCAGMGGHVLLAGDQCKDWLRRRVCGPGQPGAISGKRAGLARPTHRAESTPVPNPRCYFDLEKPA